MRFQNNAKVGVWNKQKMRNRKWDVSNSESKRKELNLEEAEWRRKKAVEIKQKLFDNDDVRNIGYLEYAKKKEDIKAQSETDLEKVADR